MASNTNRQTRSTPDMTDPPLADPADRGISINQTSAPYRSASSSSGYIIAAIVVILGFALAVYFGSRSDTSAPPVTQNNTTGTVPEGTTPPVTQNSTTATPEATAPATPPATTATQPTAPATPDTTATQPTPPAAPATQPPATTQQ